MMPHMGPQLVGHVAALWTLSGQVIGLLAANETISLGPSILTSPSSRAITARRTDAFLLVIGVFATAATPEVNDFLTLTHGWSALAHSLTSATSRLCIFL